MSTIDVITVAREFGAGGSELATALGRRLGWRVLDRDLIDRVAERLRMDPRAVEAIDEHPPHYLARVAAALHVAPPEAPMFIETADLLSPDAVAHAAREVLMESVQTPPVIVVGHGGQCLLHGRATAFHVRLVAPIERRAERLCARGACDPRSAASSIRRMDDARHAYIRRYHNADWRDPLLYDAVVNTGRITIAEAAELVVALVRARGGHSLGAQTLGN
jgi:Cytidylate kinase-like family